MNYLYSAWESKEAMCGDTHKDIALIYREIAKLHLICHRPEEAIDNFQKAKAVYEKLGTDQSLQNAASVMYSIGAIYYNNRDLKKAVECMAAAVKGVEAFNGAVHLKTVKLYLRLAEIQLELARNELKEIDRTQLDATDQSPDAGQEDEYKYENLDNAIQLYREVLRRQYKLFTENSAQVAATLQTIGDAYIAKNDYPNAVSFYQKCLSISNDVHGPDHQSTLLVMRKLSQAVNSEKQQIRRIMRE